MATNKLKFGTETPTKLYLGATEVTKTYMGETLVYEKSSSSGYDLLVGGHDMYLGDTDTIAYIKFNGVATSTDYDWKAYTKYLTSYVKDKNGNDVSFPLELNNITNVNIYLEQGTIKLFSQSFNTIGNHNIVLATNENTNISMAAYD